MTKTKTNSKPIELLPTSFARIFNLAHPCLLISTYYARFPLIVSDPVQELFQFLFPLTAIQIAYAVLCLPCIGSSSTEKAGRTIADSKRKSVEVSARISTVFLALTLTAFSIPLLTALHIVFGAPFISHHLQTVLSSTHLSLLAIFPLIYVHGIDGLKWREIVSVYCPLDEVFGSSIGAFIGGWLGAAPIPLDWDREWQKWPITIVTGMYMGYIIGKFVGGLILKGKRIELD